MSSIWVRPRFTTLGSPDGFEGALLEEAAEAAEVVERVVRAGGGLGVVLDREGAEGGGGDALVGLVVPVDVRLGEAGALERGDVDREAVVLRRDLDLAGRHVADGLVAAAVAELQLPRLAA